MSKIFEAAGDVVDDTVDFVTDNKEIIAAITLAYMTGGASTTATATTAEATALTAEAIAAEEAARIAAMEASKQAAMAETIAAAKTSGEIALANSPTAAINANAFMPTSMPVTQAYPELIGQVQPNALVTGSPTNIESIYPDLIGQVDPNSTVVMKGASQPNIFERGCLGVRIPALIS